MLSKICRICSKKFEKTSRASYKYFESQKYCSGDCYAVAKRGIPFTEATKLKMSKNNYNRTMAGNKSPTWKGDVVVYRSLHNRVDKARGTPRKCESCGTTKSKMYDWANLTGQYTDVNDYQRMCRKCHMKYDKER